MAGFEDVVETCERCHRNYLMCYIDDNGVCYACRDEQQ